MIVLGIDPGIASVGYGVVEKKGNKLRALEYGTFRTAAGEELPRRLSLIYEFLEGIMSRHRLDALAVEELFFAANVKTGIPVAHGRGVILLAGQRAGLTVAEYTPIQVKQAVTGYGRADKQQVQSMVKMLLNLSEVPRPDDTADALAIAICHAHTAGSLMSKI